MNEDQIKTVLANIERDHVKQITKLQRLGGGLLKFAADNNVSAYQHTDVSVAYAEAHVLMASSLSATKELHDKILELKQKLDAPSTKDGAGK